MKQFTVRLLTAAAAVMMAAAALTACTAPAPSGSTADEAQNSLAVQKQNSIAEKMKKEKSGTAVKSFIVKEIDLSAYRESGAVLKAANESGARLPKSVKYADGNTFSLGSTYQTMLDKGYSSERDSEVLKGHTISVNMEPQNSKGEIIAVTMRNPAAGDKPMQDCMVVTLKYYADNKKVCEDFDCAGVTKDSKLKDILDTFGKTPDTLVLSEAEQQAVLTYRDTTGGVTLEIQYSTKDDKISSFRLNMQ